MALLTQSTAPSPSMRRWFGLSLAILLLLVGWAFRAAHPVVLGSVVACSAILVAVYYAIPTTQLAVIWAWQAITYPIAWVLGHTLLLAVFCGVLLPLALVLRARGHDPLTLRSRGQKTGWINRPERRSHDDYFKQY